MHTSQCCAERGKSGFTDMKKMLGYSNFKRKREWEQSQLCTG